MIELRRTLKSSRINELGDMPWLVGKRMLKADKMTTTTSGTLKALRLSNTNVLISMCLPTQNKARKKSWKKFANGLSCSSLIAEQMGLNLENGHIGEISRCPNALSLSLTMMISLSNKRIKMVRRSTRRTATLCTMWLKCFVPLPT